MEAKRSEGCGIMSKGRLEAFTDGVIAIIITIVVLELPKIHGATFAALNEAREPLIIYVVSFVTLAIYWNNHHHLFQLAHKVDGLVLWMNNMFLFFLSLFPFATSWMGDHLFAFAPQVTFGIIILFTDVSYFGLIQALLHVTKEHQHVKELFGSSKKMGITIGLNLLAIAFAFVLPILTMIINFLMILRWIIPDKRIETIIRYNEED
jgi:uncharacterized membrane protein